MLFWDILLPGWVITRLATPGRIQYSYKPTLFKDMWWVCTVSVWSKTAIIYSFSTSITAESREIFDLCCLPNCLLLSRPKTEETHKGKVWGGPAFDHATGNPMHWQKAQAALMDLRAVSPYCLLLWQSFARKMDIPEETHTNTSMHMLPLVGIQPRTLVLW